MPTVSFTARQLLQGKIVTPAWYRMVIDNIGEEISSKGDSTNYPVDATIRFNAADGSTEFTDVPIRWNFNSKAMGFAIGFLQAFGVEVEAGVRFDMATSIGKELDVFVENGEYQGRTVNRVEHKYRPIDPSMRAAV